MIRLQRRQSGPYFAVFSLHIPDMRVEIIKICPHSPAVSLSNTQVRQAASEFMKGGIVPQRLWLPGPTHRTVQSGEGFERQGNSFRLGRNNRRLPGRHLKFNALPCPGRPTYENCDVLAGVLFNQLLFDVVGMKGYC